MSKVYIYILTFLQGRYLFRDGNVVGLERVSGKEEGGGLWLFMLQSKPLNDIN